MSMSVFGEYAACYDLVYGDKDYVGEAAFASRLVQTGSEGPMDLLELGCGTGGHAIPLARQGHRVLGVDRSADMLARAQARVVQQPAAVAANIEFLEGDVATVDVGRRFDAALAFFHVISYLTEDAALAAAFSNVRRQLKPGGRLLFDYWYGPAVVAQKPERRIRTFEDEKRVVERTMQPTWQPERRCVAIDMTLNIRNKVSGESSRIDERHTMRYFEVDELECLLSAAGFVLHRCSAWLGDAAPSEETWGACILAEA